MDVFSTNSRVKIMTDPYKYQVGIIHSRSPLNTYVVNIDSKVHQYPAKALIQFVKLKFKKGDIVKLIDHKGMETTGTIVACNHYTGSDYTPYYNAHNHYRILIKDTRTTVMEENVIGKLYLSTLMSKLNVLLLGFFF